MATFTATALQDEPLDALVWRVLGGAGGAVEQVLALNPDLAGTAAHPAPVLAEGQTVLLPLAMAPSPAPLDIVQLWE